MKMDTNIPEQTDNRFINSAGEGDLLGDDTLQELHNDDAARVEFNESANLNEAVVRKFGPQHDVDAAWKSFAVRHRLDDAENSANRPVEYMPAVKPAVPWLRRVAVIAGVAAVILFAVFIFRRGNDVKGESLYTATSDLREMTITSPGKDAVTVDKTHLVVKPVGKIEMLTLRVPKGRNAMLTLSDGSNVWVNEGSSLTYPSGFTHGNRVVKLDGEAYFKVAHDVKRPFIVQAAGVSARVLGTEFNIRSYGGAAPHVTLVSGRVEVSAGNNRRRINPGEQVTASAGRLEVSTVNVMDAVCWREGIIFFDDAPLRDVLLGICKWYNLNLVSNDTALLDVHVRFEFQRNDSVDNAIELLNQFVDGKVVRKGNTVYLN